MNEKKKTKTSMNKPGYKLTALGWIPEDWEVDLLENLTIRSSGHTPNKDYPEYYDGGIKWISLADSYRLDNGLVSETEVEISQAGLKNSSAVLLPAGTVVMSRDAGVGKSGVMAESMAVSQHFIAWTCGKKFDNWFLYYWLQQKKEYFEKQAVGSTIKTIGLPLFKKLQIVNPPLPEQRRIATILSTWDAAIAAEEKLITALQTRHRALMQRLLTGRERLKGFEGEWTGSAFESLFKQVKRPVEWNDDEQYKLVSVRRRSGGIFAREALYGHQIKVKDLRTTKTGDFLFSKMQILHGASALVTDEFDGAKISGSYIAVVARDPSKLNMEFFNWYSQLPYFYHQTYISSYGVHIEKMTFDFDAFQSLDMLLPALEEQLAIADILNASRSQIIKREQHLQYLQIQKKGMMQVLLTGKKRVNKILHEIPA